MNKMIMRLIAAGLSLALSVTVVAMSTYAWFTLSTDPSVSGIQMTVGGDNTILVAADMTAAVDGMIYHYPGTFSDTLNFGQHESYEYLKSLGGLTPVSTADGLHWFLPTGTGDTGSDIYEAELPNGQITDFRLDSSLEYANLASGGTDGNNRGSYVYLDFWVVSPTADYTLRVSTGEDGGGSFLINLPQAREDGSGSYELTDGSSVISAIARVGFLVNPDQVEDESIRYYWSSGNADNIDYTTLRGNYAEPGSNIPADASYRFMIYEPNGDYHPGNTTLGGDYVTTKPIGWDDNGQAAPLSVKNRTAVQRYSAWKPYAEGGSRWIDLIFESFLVNRDLTDMDEEDVTNAFYGSFAGQLSTYVQNGEFVPNASQLGDTVSADILNELDPDDVFIGASEDVYIVRLERNVPQRIRMFVWLEGQDADCTNNATVSSFALNLELAGGSK